MTVLSMRFFFTNGTQHKHARMNPDAHTDGKISVYSGIAVIL